MPDTDLVVDGGDNGGSLKQHFFSTPEISQRLDLLRHLTDNSERVVVLRGAPGSGKSTLFQRYQQSAREEWAVCPVISNPMLHPEQLFILLGQGFGVSATDDTIVDQLLERFEMLQEVEGRTPVIVVDDAHMLPLSTIIALLRLYERRSGDNALVRIILFSSPQIDDLLRTPQIQAMNLQVLQMLELPVLTGDQVRDFIAFIIGGSEGGGAFDEAEVERIAKASGGIPGAVEEQVLAVLKVRAAATRSSDSGEVESNSTQLHLSKPALFSGAALGVLIILALLFQDGINQLFEGGDQSLPVQSDSSEIELKLPGLADAAPVPALEPAKVPSGAAQVVEAPAPEVEPPEAEPVMIEPAEPVSSVTHEQTPEGVMVEEVEYPAAAVDTTSVVGGTRDPEGLQQQPVATLETEIEPQSVVTVVDEADTPIILVEEDSEEEVSQVEVSVDEKKTADQPPVKVTVEEKTIPVQPPTERREAWLLVQNPEAFTLQLIGVQNEAAAYSFVARHKIADKSAIFVTQREGKPWVSVVYGVYAGRDVAVAARGKLPAGLRRGGVWPRNFASIQQAIISQ